MEIQDCIGIVNIVIGLGRGRPVLRDGKSDGGGWNRIAMGLPWICNPTTIHVIVAALPRILGGLWIVIGGQLGTLLCNLWITPNFGAVLLRSFMVLKSHRNSIWMCWLRPGLASWQLCRGLGWIAVWYLSEPGLQNEVDMARFERLTYWLIGILLIVQGLWKCDEIGPGLHDWFWNVPNRLDCCDPSSRRAVAAICLQSVRSGAILSIRCNHL